jgi:hypothetical protein
MAKYERSGKVRVPQWWLDKVLPILDDPSVRLADVAKAASQHAGRASPWKGDAVSKFASGTVRTIELANGIAAALHVPQPFFTAPSEAAASAMVLIVERERAHDEEDKRKLAAYDASQSREVKSVSSGVTQNAAVVSPDHGNQGGRGSRAGRAGRGRS